MDDEQRQTSSVGEAFSASAGVKPRVSAGMADSSVSAQKTEGPMFPSGEHLTSRTARYGPVCLGGVGGGEAARLPSIPR